MQFKVNDTVIDSNDSKSDTEYLRNSRRLIAVRTLKYRDYLTLQMATKLWAHVTTKFSSIIKLRPHFEVQFCTVSMKSTFLIEIYNANEDDNFRVTSDVAEQVSDMLYYFKGAWEVADIATLKNL